MSPSEWVIWGGLGIGLLYGIVAQISGFCLNSALRNQSQRADGTKLRAFLLACAIAMLGAQYIDMMSVVPLAESIYASKRISFVLIIFGGLLFGYGMILTRGCGARSLVLLGQGNLRSLLVLLCLGISAYATLTGVLAPWRAQIQTLTAIELTHYSFTSDSIRWGVAGVFGLAVLAFILKDRQFLRQPKEWISGLVIGLLIVAGWLCTGWLGYDEFSPTAPWSLTFVAPTGATIQYLMIATGTSVNFGIMVVTGVLIGSFISAVSTRTFKVTGFDDTYRMPRHITGGVMMGIGGALAMGCSVGQGLTGMSTLAFSSMAAFASIVMGALLALRTTRDPETPRLR